MLLGPSEPSSLKIVSVNSSSVTLQWGPPDTPNGVITQYSIQRNGTDVVNLSSNVLMYTIEGLLSETLYLLQLTAHTGAGAGPSNSVTIIIRKFLNAVTLTLFVHYVCNLSV